jgi:hypothetical protein
MSAFTTAFLSGLVFSLVHLLSMYLLLQHFTIGLIPQKIVIKNNYAKKLPPIAFLFLVVLLTPPVLFRISAASLSNAQVLWGCYIEYFGLGVIMLASGLLLCYTLLLLIGLFNPKNLKFRDKKDLLLAFLIIAAHTILISFIGIKIILLFSGELHGKEASCL